MLRCRKTRFLIAIGGFLAFGIAHHAAIGQSQVNMRVELNRSAPAMSSGSIRYHNQNQYATNTSSRLLPSESRHLIRASGLLPSEHRYQRYMDGSLRTEGVATHLQRPTIRYNQPSRPPPPTPPRPTIRYSQTKTQYNSRRIQSGPLYQTRQGIGSHKIDGKINPVQPYSRGTIRYGG